MDSGQGTRYLCLTTRHGTPRGFWGWLFWVLVPSAFCSAFSPPQEDQEPREEPVEVAAPEVRLAGLWRDAGARPDVMQTSSTVLLSQVSKIDINTPGSRTVVGDSDTSPEGDPGECLELPALPSAPCMSATLEATDAHSLQLLPPTCGWRCQRAPHSGYQRLVQGVGDSG